LSLYKAAMSPESALHVDPASLPDDLELLKSLIAQLFEALREKDRSLESLRQRIDLLLRKLYGRSSEKFSAAQATLFDLAAETVAEQLPPPPAPALPAKTPAAKGGHGRRRAPDMLQRVPVVHDLTPAEKESLGGEANLIPLPDEVTEQWEWKPSCLFVLEHRQKKYLRRPAAAEAADTATTDTATADTTASDAAASDATVTDAAASGTAVTDATASDASTSDASTAASPSDASATPTDSEISAPPVIVASKPPQAIPGGVAGPGLLAQVIVSKASDHLPLHRQERIWERQGLALSRQTTCDWYLACADLSRPLVELMARETLASAVVHIDDTRVDLRDAHAKLKFQGHLWVRIGDDEHPHNVFDYMPDRSRDGPKKLLAGYRGYVQADAYSGYDGVYLDSGGAILEVACWAHARRKFHDARRLDQRAEIALARIGQLYALEKKLRERCAGEWRELSRAEQYARIAAERQSQARPLLAGFLKWLEAETPALLPQNPVRGAMEYLQNHWAAFCRYTDDGRLNIDNNAAEREMKHVAVGRKNWLFCASERGAHAAAIHFSLIATCRRHKVEPWAYLRDLFTQLPLLRDRGQLDAEHLRPLLPHLWRPPA
jgi:hypothetical protein